MVNPLKCPHRNVQQFTECCLDCGYNIYTFREDYAREQRKAQEEANRDPDAWYPNKYPDM